MQVLWRIEGKSFDPYAFIYAHELPYGSVWRRGDKTRRGKRLSRSGLHVIIAQETYFKRLLSRTAKFIETHPKAFRAAKRLQVENVISIAFSAASPSYVARCEQIPAPLLSLLARYDVALEIFAYACSDDAKGRRDEFVRRPEGWGLGPS